MKSNHTTPMMGVVFLLRKIDESKKSPRVVRIALQTVHSLTQKGKDMPLWGWIIVAGIVVVIVVIVRIALRSALPMKKTITLPFAGVSEELLSPRGTEIIDALLGEPGTDSERKVTLVSHHEITSTCVIVHYHQRIVRTGETVTRFVFLIHFLGDKEYDVTLIRKVLQSELDYHVPFEPGAIAELSKLKVETRKHGSEIVVNFAVHLFDEHEKMIGEVDLPSERFCLSS